MNIIRVWLDNAATSGIQISLAVIRILLVVNLYLYLVCVSLNSMLNNFHRISDLVKVYRYFYFIVGLRANQRLYPDVG